MDKEKRQKELEKLDQFVEMVFFGNKPRSYELHSLTPEEERAKEYMMNKFGPALHTILSEHNPIEYIRWSGNACRQTAVLGVQIMKELLPDYKWYAWDGDFKDILIRDGEFREVEYNHAWIYGINHKTKRKLLVDVARNEHERLFIVVDDNEYPKDHPDYKYMKELRKHKMDVKKKMKDVEYYTALKSWKLLDLVKEKIELMEGDNHEKN